LQPPSPPTTHEDDLIHLDWRNEEERGGEFRASASVAVSLDTSAALGAIRFFSEGDTARGRQKTGTVAIAA